MANGGQICSGPGLVAPDPITLQCPSGTTFDQVSECCAFPSSGNVLEIPSLPGLVALAPPGVQYTGQVTGGLPPSFGSGLSSIIPVLEALLGSIGAVLFEKFLTHDRSKCPCGGSVERLPFYVINSCGCWELPPRRKPPAPCPTGEFPQPCRPDETVDPATNCCATPSAPKCAPCPPGTAVTVNCICEPLVHPFSAAAIPGGA